MGFEERAMCLDFRADERRISASLKGENPTVEIPWTDLKSVAVVTNSKGPFDDDVWIEIASTAGTAIEIPLREMEKTLILDRVLNLPAFDHLLYVCAMGSTADLRTEVWIRGEQSDDTILTAVSDANTLPREPEAIGLRNPYRFFKDLAARYSQSGRYHHNWKHIRECLAEFWRHEGSWCQPREVWCALLFHDVVYRPGRNDNEQQSADYAFDKLSGLNVDRDRVTALILCTAHHQTIDRLSSFDDDARRLVDIDRSILGATAVRYLIYAMGIELEYRTRVCGWRFLIGRARFLRYALKQPRVFLTEGYERELGSRAKENMKREWRSMPMYIRTLALLSSDKLA